MWVNLLFFLQFFISTFALTQDQIFQADWQSVHIGVPFDSLLINDKLLTLSDLGVFSILNSTSGGVLYRYQSETLPIKSNSGLVRVSNDQVISYLNFDLTPDNYYNSKLLFWNISKLSAEIQSDFDFKNNILSVIAVDDLTYVVDQQSISVIDARSNYKITTIYESNELISDAKTFKFSSENSNYVLLEINDELYYSNLKKLELKPFVGCCLADLRFYESVPGLLICNDEDVYAFDDYGVQKLISNSNMINGKLSADSLVNTPVDDFKLVGDYVLVNSNHFISVHNHKSTSLSSDFRFDVPLSLLNSVYYSYFVSKNNSTEISLLLVSSDMVVEYYINGKLQWFSDQSFTKIIDAVIIDSKLESTLTLDELIYETNSNIFLSYIRRLCHNYNSLFGNSRSLMDEANKFGMMKKIVALAENGKIGVFNLFKNNDSSPQLINIYNPTIKFSKIYQIDNRVYGISESSIYDIDITLGKVLQTSSDFISDHFKLITYGDLEIDLVGTTEPEFYTTSFSKKQNTIQGHYILDDQVDTWKYSPENETIISLEKRTYGNSDVAQNAIVLSDRSLLYKYLVPNIGVITTYYEKEKNGILMFDLKNLITGQSYGKFSKEVRLGIKPELEVQVAFEENFIVFTVPDSNSPLDTQICVIDLFESLKPDEKLTKGMLKYSSLENTVLPSFASQCFILTGTRLKDLAISKTKHNISNKAIILRTSLGQIISIPKIVIDGRRDGVIGDFKNIKNQGSCVLLEHGRTSIGLPKINSSKYFKSVSSSLPYDAIINLNPQFILSHFRKLITNDQTNGYSLLMTEPTELESTTYVVSIDGDIFVNVLRPSGSFDRLTSSFNTKFVILTIVILLTGIAFVRPKTEKMKLFGLWAL